MHFRSYLDMIFEWLPQQLFLLSTFGYMCVLIIVKWNIPWVVEYPLADAPSIIGQMIALPLKLGSTEGKVLSLSRSRCGTPRARRACSSSCSRSR